MSSIPMQAWLLTAIHPEKCFVDSIKFLLIQQNIFLGVWLEIAEGSFHATFKGIQF